MGRGVYHGPASMTTLLVLHGYSMNAAVMREGLGEHTEQLQREVEVVFVEAPHACSDASVARLYALWKTPRLAPPYLMWWDSSEDGREYRGWEESRERIRTAMGDGNVALLGFSQGAILTAAVAALAEHGEMPPVRFAILVAGRTPRADVIQPFLTKPLRTPSLHVWGTEDTLATAAISEKLSTHFDPATREIAAWAGSHRVPTRGEGAEAILGFVKKHRGG